MDEAKVCIPRADLESLLVLARRTFGDTHPLTARCSRALHPAMGIVRADTDAFDRFWAVYPRKVEKIAARKSFAKAAMLAPADQIIAAAERYAARIKAEGGEYVKHPTTWLNRGCWEDEDVPPKPRDRVARNRLTLVSSIDQQGPSFAERVAMAARAELPS